MHIHVIRSSSFAFLLDVTMAASSSHSINTEHHNSSGRRDDSVAEPPWRSDPSRGRRSPQTSASEPMPPCVMICKSSSATVLDIDTRYRKPDVGIGISVQLSPATNCELQQYYGEYIGHGLYKISFLLRKSPDISAAGAYATEYAPQFDGKVLKLSKRTDIEPEVFRRASSLGVTTSILFETTAIDTDTNQQFHCWITERCIPLDKIIRQFTVKPTRCSIAIYYCLLRAAQAGINITDCGFQNFGLVVNDATEHSIVVIDAGNQAVKSEPWAKSRVNSKIMHKFWTHCEHHGAEIPELQMHWRRCQTVSEALLRAREEWEKSEELISELAIQSNAIAAAITNRQEERLALAKETHAYKIINAVGRAVAEFTWTDDIAAECQKVSESLCLGLSLEDDAQITELYERLHRGSSLDAGAWNDTVLQDKVQFWKQIDEFRRQHTNVDALSKKDADSLLQLFRTEVLYSKLTERQKKQNVARQNSILFTILHNYAGYKHVANAIMRYGLPQLIAPWGSNDIQEHMVILAQFAATMVRWLKDFAAGMRELAASEQYQREVSDSARALKRRKRGQWSNRW